MPFVSLNFENKDFLHIHAFRTRARSNSLGNNYTILNTGNRRNMPKCVAIIFFTVFFFPSKSLEMIFVRSRINLLCSIWCCICLCSTNTHKSFCEWFRIRFSHTKQCVFFLGIERHILYHIFWAWKKFPSSNHYWNPLGIYAHHEIPTIVAQLFRLICIFRFY